MPELEYEFPTFEEITAASLAGKTLGELITLRRELGFQMWELENFYNDKFCRAKEYSTQYYEAQAPLRVSLERVGAALYPFYVVSTYEKQARVERERAAA